MNIKHGARIPHVVEPSVSGLAQGCSLEARPVLIILSSPNLLYGYRLPIGYCGKVKGEGVTLKFSSWVTA